jgi:ketosteroid isomerase-like protein
MQQHPVAVRFSKAAAEVADGNFDSFLDGFSNEATWVVPGRNPLAGTYHGKDGILSFFTETAERTGDGFHPQPIEALADDGHAVLFLRVTGRRSGADLDVKIAHFATVDSDGHLERNWFLPDDLEAWDAFLA